MKSTKPTNILIALDYDPTSQKVAEAGFWLAKAMKAEITLLHIIREPLQYSILQHVTIMGFAGHSEKTPLHFESIEGLKKISEEFLEQSKLHLGDHLIRTQVKEGEISESIISTAKESEADYIVMGSHSRSLDNQITMGSVLEKVIHLTSIPVVVIPTK